jgi:hypothetical protein
MGRAAVTYAQAFTYSQMLADSATGSALTGYRAKAYADGVAVDTYTDATMTTAITAGTLLPADVDAGEAGTDTAGNLVIFFAPDPDVVYGYTLTGTVGAGAGRDHPDPGATAGLVGCPVDRAEHRRNFGDARQSTTTW